MFYFKSVKKLLRAVPGKKYLGEYRFLPVFFVAGAALEYVMINWHVGETNFYRTYKKRKVQEIIEQRERAEIFPKNIIGLKQNS